MADMILTPITELILETLCSAAVKEIQSLWGVKDDLEDLERTLSRIKAVLLDAEKQQAHNNQVRDWLEKLEDVSYDADNLVDEVAAEGLLWQKLIPENKIVKKVRTFFSCCNQVVFRQKMAQQIKRIRKELAKIESDQRGLNLEVRQEIQLERNARETGTNVDEENIVGRDRDITEILKQLLSAEAETGSSTTHRERVSVIPIIGMGGLGKTTLAQVVYNNDEVEKHFNLRLWVCVSDNVDNNPLIEKVVRSITNTSTKYLSMPKLEETIQEKIKGKRLLLILDDVWKQEINQEWERLKGLLGKNCVEGSRIVVTTRDDMVARVMGGKQPYHLGQLNPEDSWNLFKKKAFQHGHEPTDPTIFDIAKKILAKCGGVPLAISLIGSMLYHRDQKREWKYILENELSNLPHAKDGILGTLRLSYDCLPSSLKPCFAYCSLFPKNHEFDVQTLVTLWIAQGFISSNKSQLSLEEIGYEYFEDLLWRSFFQEAKKDEVLNVVKTCKMHDLVHDLATQVAGEKYAALASCEDNISRKFHVSFNNNDSLTLQEVPSSWLQAQRLRSFLFPPKCYGIKFKRDSKWDEVIPNVKFLRMLDLHDVGIRTMPHSIGKLKHVRYLDLSENKIETLPTAITKLVNLQTLKLNKCYNLHELPSKVYKLVNLRHLELKDSHKITLPRGLGQLINLQTLSHVVLGENIPNRPCSKPDVLMGLNNLRGKLEIKGIRSGMVTSATKMQEKTHLQSLYLYFKNSDDDASSSEQQWETTLEGLQPHLNLRELTLESYGGASLFGFLPTLTNLVKLSLKDCLKCQQLPSLNDFHSLKEMAIYGLPALEYITINEGDSYVSTSSSLIVSVLPSLQKLELYNLPNFRGWWRPDMAENQVEPVIFLSFPCLSSLTIQFCPKFTSKPCCPNVEELKLWETSWKQFELTMLMRDPTIAQYASTSSTTSSDSVSPYQLTKLRSLFLGSVEDLQFLPDDWVKSLASLKKLSISSCPELRYIQYLTSLEELMILECKEFEAIKWPETPTPTSLRILELKRLPKLECLLSPSIQYLASLQELRIIRCQGLQLSNDTEWKALRNLRTLIFEELPQLVTLPDGLEFVTTLVNLQVLRCYYFKAIPNWICKLRSLERLTIRHCQSFELLPTSIKSLASLRYLEINGEQMDASSLTSENCRYIKNL